MQEKRAHYRSNQLRLIEKQFARHQLKDLGKTVKSVFEIDE